VARARNIKPGFFTNDMLAECTPLARLLFAGLWLHCDREGRMEDRPKKIKAEILPYDTCNADELLGELEKHGFIIRYQHDDRRFIQVTNFGKHQNPHIKEAPSEIPAPYKNSASTVQASETPEAAGLNPSSPILNPESPTTTTDASAPAAGGGGDVPDGRDELDPPATAPMPPRQPLPAPASPAAAIAVVLRPLGVSATAMHPTVMGWADRAVSLEVLTEAVRIAREHKGTETISPQYLAPIVERLLTPQPDRRSAPRTGGGQSQKFHFAEVDRSADVAMMQAQLAARGVTQADLDDDSPL
jgi:hypothetical protein